MRHLAPTLRRSDPHGLHHHFTPSVPRDAARAELDIENETDIALQHYSVPTIREVAAVGQKISDIFKFLSLNNWPLPPKLNNKNIDAVHERFMSVTFTLVGTTQGLAIGNLAQKMTEVLTFDVSWANLEALTGCILCFFVLARVTQAYICGALEYSQNIFSPIDLFGILFIGTLQYVLMNAIASEGNSEFSLHFRFAILSAIAILMHLYQKKKIEKSPYDNASAIKMQQINIYFTLVVTALGFIGWLVSHSAVRIPISIIITIILCVNIVISLRDTDFDGKKRIAV